MNNECGNVHTSVHGNTYLCEVAKGHSGDHKRWDRHGNVVKSWPRTNSIPNPSHPSMYAKGGFTPVSDSFEREWLRERTKLNTDVTKFKIQMKQTLDKIDKELKALEAEETPVLLTKEDLIAISYYLPPYSDDADDEDNIVKDKIYAALKEML